MYYREHRVGSVAPVVNRAGIINAGGENNIKHFTAFLVACDFGIERNVIIRVFQRIGRFRAHRFDHEAREFRIDGGRVGYLYRVAGIRVDGMIIRRLVLVIFWHRKYAEIGFHAAVVLDDTHPDPVEQRTVFSEYRILQHVVYIGVFRAVVVAVENKIFVVQIFCNRVKCSYADFVLKREYRQLVAVQRCDTPAQRV